MSVQAPADTAPASLRHQLPGALGARLSCSCVSAGKCQLRNAPGAPGCHLDPGEPRSRSPKHLHHMFRGGGRFLSEQQEILGECQNHPQIFVLLLYTVAGAWCLFLQDFLEAAALGVGAGGPSRGGAPAESQGCVTSMNPVCCQGEQAPVPEARAGCRLSLAPSTSRG